jgi:hypothetical protein
MRGVFFVSEARYGRKNPWRSFESSIFEATDLSIYEKMAYIVISSHATTTDQRSWPSYSTIAKKASMSDRKAKQAVKVLEKKGLIVKAHRYIEKLDETTGELKRENTSNLYVIFPYDQPFNPEIEWVDQEGNVHDKGVVNDMHHPSAPHSPPPVHTIHYPSEQHAPPLVHTVHPNKTITNKTKINKTITNKTTYQNEIEIAQKEAAVTKENDLVVEVKLHIFNSFEIELSNQEITRLIQQSAKHRKNLVEVIQATKDHFLSANQPINDLMAALVHGIQKGWDKPKKAVVSKPLPQSIAKAQVQNIQPEEDDEDLTDTLEDIKNTLEFLRSTEKQVL